MITNAQDMGLIISSIIESGIDVDLENKNIIPLTASKLAYIADELGIT